MEQVEFVVGREWQHDVRYLDGLRPHRPADSQPNLAEIGDIIDLVVGSKNITASISEESIFPFVADLCEALLELGQGRRAKAIVEFRREPWELVIVPDGKALALTLYSVDDESRVVAHDVLVDAAQFFRVVGDSAQQLLRDLYAISDAFGSDPFVRRFSAHVGKMKRLEPVKFASRADDESLERAGSTSAARGLTLSYGVDVGGPGFRAYGGEHSYDLHALLVPGYVCCEWSGREVVICDDYPFLALKGLVQRTRDLFNAVESHRTRFQCDEELPRGIFDVVGERTTWSVRLGRKDDVLEFELGQAEALECFIGFAELMLGDLEEANATLQLNQRFLDLKEDVASLRAWLGDFGGSNTYLETPEEYLRENGNVRPTELAPIEKNFAWPFASVRRLHPRPSWRFDDPHIHFGSISARPETLLVPTSTALNVLDIETGETRWVVGTDEESPSSYALCGETVVVGHASRALRFYDFASGEELCEVADAGAFVLDAAYYEVADLVVAGEFHGGLVGVRRSSGRVVWRRSEEDNFISGIAFDGPLVSTLSSNGFLTSYNPLTGEVLWRVRIGGTPDGGPYFHRGRLYTFSHDETARSLSIHALYPYTGRVAWQLRIEGWIAGRPQFVGDQLLVPVERYGKVTLHAIPVEDLRPETAWRLELTSAGLDRPTRVETFESDGEAHGVVRTDRSDLIAFRLRDGEPTWRVQTDPKTTLLYRNIDVEVIRDAVLSVGESVQLRDRRTGELMHSFGGVMIAPEYACVVGQMGVIIGEPGADDGYPDELVRHELQHFLAVVD